jgi:phosphatidylserine decarboxylase
MSWLLLFLGIVASVLLMLVLSAKWKLPQRPALIGAIVVTLLAAVPFLWIYPACKTAAWSAIALCGQIALAVGIGLALVMERFWRDPERVPPETEGVILCAADGRVVYVRKVSGDSMPLVSKGDRDYRLIELTGTGLVVTPVYVVGVGMSLLDVHVNRCPISGQIKFLKRATGGHMSLGRDEAPFLNQRFTTVIENASLTVAVVQVASRLVRNIQNYLTVDERVAAGQRLGMIRLGSLVAIIFPDRGDVRVEVRPGDYVMAGISVLARYGADVAVDD